MMQALLTPNVAGGTGIRTHATMNLWIFGPALYKSRHKSTPAERQTESGPVPTTTLFPPFFRKAPDALIFTRLGPSTELHPPKSIRLHPPGSIGPLPSPAWVHHPSLALVHHSSSPALVHQSSTRTTIHKASGNSAVAHSRHNDAGTSDTKCLRHS